MFGRDIERKPLILQRPDYIEHRDEQVLLVWRDIPHWMVVDDEMKAFVFLFEQPRSFSELFSNHTYLKPHRKALTSLVRQLSSKGILHSPDQARNVLQSEVSTKPLPIENVAWNLTHKCNLRCVYCYYLETLNDSTNDELSAGEVIDFLKNAKPFISKRATLTVLGGEPLLYPAKLIEVCEYVRKQKMNPLISTNGTLIDEAFAKEAKRIGLEVQVSLDGLNAEMNDPLRGQGSFEKVRKGVDILKRHGVHTILSMVCTRCNFDSLKYFLDLAIEWGVSEARFIPLKMMGGAKTGRMEMVPHFKIVTAAYQLLKDTPEYRDLLGRDCLSILANTCRYSARRSSCGTGSQTLLLDADGTLYPCLNLNQKAYAFGNIREKNFHFEKIWENHKILSNVRTCVSVHNTGRPCNDCPVKYWCLGGCRGETVVNTGDLKAQSIHCGDLRKTILEIFWILAENPDIIKTYEQMG